MKEFFFVVTSRLRPSFLGLSFAMFVSQGVAAEDTKHMSSEQIDRMVQLLERQIIVITDDDKSSRNLFLDSRFGWTKYAIIPPEFDIFAKENKEILQQNIKILRSGRKIPLQKFFNYFGKQCELGSKLHPTAMVQYIAYHLYDLNEPASNSGPPSQITITDTSNCPKTSPVLRPIGLSEAQELLRASMDARVPKIQFDPVVRFVIKTEESFQIVEELPISKEIYVELHFEDDEPDTAHRLVEIDTGSDSVELMAFRVDAKLFRTKYAFELRPDIESAGTVQP